MSRLDDILDLTRPVPLRRGLFKYRFGGWPCRACHHDKTAHSHYRRGSDCAVCMCPRWRPALIPPRRHAA